MWYLFTYLIGVGITLGYLEKKTLHWEDRWIAILLWPLMIVIITLALMITYIIVPILDAPRKLGNFLDKVVNEKK